MPERTTDIAVAGLGGALVVFFAGTAAAIATGNMPPTEMWAAGGAISGGLLGLLVPSPMVSSPTADGVPHLEAAAAQHETAAERYEQAAHEQATASPQGVTASLQDAAQAHTEAAEQRAKAADVTAAASQQIKPRLAVFLLLVLFGILLAGGYLLASGEVKPPAEFHKSLEGLTTAVVALASAAGSALVGLLAPSPSQTATHK